MIFFFCPEIKGYDITLSEEESKHCVRVLRLKKNDTLCLVDGKGNLYHAFLIEPDVKKCKVRILKSVSGYKPRKYYLHIAIAPTKSMERFEWFLEKSTEIGIDEITPVICERSGRTRLNMARAEKILIAAMKQSQRAYLPVLNSLLRFADLPEKISARSKVITHCNKPGLPIISRQMISSSPTLILIGPEGDFTPSEVEFAASNGFSEASLGPFIYRTETAGILACHTFNSYFKQ